MLQDNLIIAVLSFLSAILAIRCMVISVRAKSDRKLSERLASENTKLVDKIFELQETAKANEKTFNQMKETNKKNCETIRKNTELANRKIRLNGWLGFVLASLIH